MTEKELVQEYILAKEEVESMDDKLKTAKDRFEKAQAKLVDFLQMQGASQTAKYDGFGRISILKPIVGARSLNDEALFEYLKQIGRDDLMRLTVHHKTLSSFVKEKLDVGEEIPEFIEHWYKPVTRLNK